MGMLHEEYKYLLDEWDCAKNKDIDFYKLRSKSNKKVWWICKKGHEWSAVIYNRSFFKNNCPYCSGRLATRDNCLAKTHPWLIDEWDYKKNSDKNPFNVKRCSNLNIWWKCKKGHEWQARLADRTLIKIKSNGTKTIQRCPYCSGQRITDNNRLSKRRPWLIDEWDHKKNILTPDDVSFSMSKKVWWICKNGHSWESTINNREHGNGCPKCFKLEIYNGVFVDSLIEAYYYIKFKELGLLFDYNKEYGSSFGRFRFDFFFPLENKYVEVTSFMKKSGHFKKYNIFYNKYLRKISKKRKYVESIGAKFDFIQESLSKEKIEYIRKVIKQNQVL